MQKKRKHFAQNRKTDLQTFSLDLAMQKLNEPKSNEHNQLIQRLLHNQKRAKALTWLKGSNADDKRTIGAFTTSRASVKFVQEIYDAGAIEVIAVHIRKKLRQASHHAAKLVVKLPSDAKSRRKIFAWCKRQGDSLGYSPDPDRGESHLFLLLD